MKRYLIEVLLSVKDKEKGEWKFTIKFGDPLKSLSTIIFDDIKNEISEFKKDGEWEALADLYVGIAKWIFDNEGLQYKNVGSVLNSKGIYDIFVEC
jgi:hypothetical protein